MTPLTRDGAYDFGLGVVLRTPTDPSGIGGSASYRVEYRIEPVIPGRPKAQRRYRYARDVGEAFALALRIEIREQVHKSRRKTLPPKWRKRRWAFAPAWLTDDLDRLLADTHPGALLFGSPGRPVRSPDGTVTRIGPGLYPYSNWRERTWEKLVAATPDWPAREDWWDPSAGPTPAGRQTERRWSWPIHSLRHVAATYQLNTLGLDPDDVAKFLGHRSGAQVWEMYVRVRPELFGRAAAASRAAGDPRAT